MNAWTLAAALAIVTGFLLSVPVGPVASIVIRRALERGSRAGLAAGAGVALADAVYGAAGIAGLALPFAGVLASPAARVLAGLVLVALGGLVLRSAPAPGGPVAPATLRTHATGFVTTLTLGLANPGAIAIVAAVFAVGDPGAREPRFVPVTLAALFIGAMLWWTTLVVALARARHRLGARTLRAINVATGTIAIIAGIAAIVRAIVVR